MDQPPPATDDFTALSITPTHDPEFYPKGKLEWLPRHARFEGQIGPALTAPGRVWRELSIRLQSGPAYLYGYLPFACAIYVNERPAVLLEFSAELEEQTALVRVPVGERFAITIVSELAGSPARTGHGTDTRELALLFHGASTGKVVNAPLQTAIAVPNAYAALDPSGQETVTPRPIFVIGSYRSGTSVLTWALGQHPDIWPIEETGWLAMLANGALAGYQSAVSASRSFFDVCGVSREDYMAHTGRAVDNLLQFVSRRHLHGIFLGRLSGTADEFNEDFQLARSLMSPKRRWVDGTPEHAGDVHTLRELFPAAKFVGLVRDPLDVVASMLRFDRAGGLKTDIPEAADVWLRTTRWTLWAARAFGPNVVRLLRHEQLVEAPQATLAELFEFLDEPDFPKAVQTFGTRINSSQVGDEERAVIRREIDAVPGTKASLLAVYDDVLETMQRPWQPDPVARRELEETQHDLVTKMLTVVNCSGSPVDVPSA